MYEYIQDDVIIKHVNNKHTPIITQVWLQSSSAKGLEVSGTFALRQGSITMEMAFTNKALQAMGNFEIQFNKNR